MAGNTRSLTFSEGVTVSSPSQSFLTASSVQAYADDAAYVTAKGGAAADGDFYYDTTLDVIKIYADGAWSKLVDNDSVQTLVNKLFVDASNSFVDDGDDTRVMKLELGGITAGNTRTWTVPDSSDTFVGKATTDVMTNKTLTSPAINGANQNMGTASDTNRIVLPDNTSSNLDGLTDTAGLLAYDTDLGKPVYNDGAAWNPVGSGSGGGINYVSNYDAESNAADTTSDSNFTIARNTTTPLRGNGDFILTKASGGDYSTQKVIFGLDTLNRADLASVIKVTFDYDFTDADYTDDEFGVIAYDNDETNEIELVPRGIKAGKGTYVGYFQSHATSTDYDLWIINDKTTNSEIIGYIDNVSVGPAQYSFGPVVTDWEAFTPTGSWSTNVLYTGYKRRVGDTLECEVKITASGGTDAANCTIYIPNGMLIDTNKMHLEENDTRVGFASVKDSGSGVRYQGFVTVKDSNEVILATFQDSTTYENFGVVSNTDPVTIALNDEVLAHFSVPIVGWSSSQQISDDADTRVVAAVYQTNTADEITNGVEEVIYYDEKIIDTHGAVSATDFATQDWLFSAPCSGKYHVCASHGLAASADFSGTEYYLARIYKNSTETATAIKHPPADNVMKQIDVSTILDLSAGDTISIKVQQNSGANINQRNSDVYNRVSIHKISGPSAIAANELVAASYSTNTGNNVDSASWDVIDYEDKAYDTHNCVTVGSAWKFTAPIAGKYLVTAQFEFTGSSDWEQDEICYFSIYLNGIENRRLFTYEVPATFDVAAIVGGSGSTVMDLDVGDYINVQIYQTSDNVRPLDSSANKNYISIVRQGF